MNAHPDQIEIVRNAVEAMHGAKLSYEDKSVIFMAVLAISRLYVQP